jgi:hypothetical protein
VSLKGLSKNFKVFRQTRKIKGGGFYEKDQFASFVLRVLFM